MPDEFPTLSAKERLILEMLVNGGEMYGLEMVKKSEGNLKRGTIYVMLSRMADKGYVDSRQVKEPGASGLPKRLFTATGHGQRVFYAWEMARAAWAGGMAG